MMTLQDKKKGRIILRLSIYTLKIFYTKQTNEPLILKKIMTVILNSYIWRVK